MRNRPTWPDRCALFCTFAFIIAALQGSAPQSVGKDVRSSDQATPQSLAAAPEKGGNWTSPATGMEFVWIKALNMWVGKYEVTNEEYRKKEPNHDSGDYRGHDLNGDRQPVVRMLFKDAQAFAAWLTDQEKDLLGEGRYRLPSNDEWTTFVQCGDDRVYPWGNEWPPPIGRAGNYHDQDGAGPWSKIGNYRDGFAVTAPVDELWASPWGLHGAGGNVWEVCASDTTGEAFGAWRGASWSISLQGALRCAYRYRRIGYNRRNYRGFRLVLSR